MFTASSRPMSPIFLISSPVNKTCVYVFTSIAFSFTYRARRTVLPFVENASSLARWPLIGWIFCGHRAFFQLGHLVRHVQLDLCKQT